MKLHIQRFLLDKNEFSLEHRILNVAIAIGAFLCLFSAHTNHLLDLGAVTVVTSAMCGLLLLFCGYISVYKKNYHLAAYMTLTVIVIIVLPIMHFSNGGIFGSIPYFMVMLSGVISIVFKGTKKIVFTAGYIFAISMLVLIEYNIPDMVVEYKSYSAKFVDVTLSIYLALIFNAVLFNVVAANHGHERMRAEELNRLLIEEKQRLERLSIIDGLTNIYNHRFIVDYLEKEMDNCKKKDGVLTVIFLDIDNFKIINDNHGHLFGDYVLKRISETITGNLRGTDLVGRYGGEEFLIVLPCKSLEVGYIIADRIREEISLLEWENNIHVTVSGGVAEFDDEKLHELLDKADDLLYKAKKLGKNRIEKATVLT